MAHDTEDGGDAVAAVALAWQRAQQAHAAWRASWEEAPRHARDAAAHAARVAARAASLERAATELGLALLDARLSAPTWGGWLDATPGEQPGEAAPEAPTAIDPDATAATHEPQPPIALDPPASAAEPDEAERLPGPRPAAAKPTAAAVSPIDLAGFVDRFNNRDVLPASAPDDDGQRLRALAALRDAAGGVPRTLGAAEVRGEVTALEAAAEVAAWQRLADDDKVLALEWLAARARAAQDLGGDAALAERVNTLIRRLSSRLHGVRNGQFVHGLGKKQRPKGATWHADALHLQRDLDKRLGRTRRASDLDQSAEIDDDFRRLRAAAAAGDGPTVRVLAGGLLGDRGVRIDDKRWGCLAEYLALLNEADAAQRRVQRRLAELMTAADAEDGDEEDAAEGWPGLAFTRGKRLLIVGGDSRGERIPKIRHAFALDHVEWETLAKNQPRAKDAMVERLRAGQYDIVVCLQRFISHELTDAIWDAELPDVTRILAQGYGLGQLRKGLERFLPRR